MRVIAIAAAAILATACGSSSGEQAGGDVDASTCVDDACGLPLDGGLADTIDGTPGSDGAADTVAVDGGKCAASGVLLGDGCPHLLAAMCTPDRSKVYLCGKVDDCLVWTEGAACVTGTACQSTGTDTATCCIAPGTTPGSACPSSGATTCVSGGKVLDCAAKAPGECLLWSAPTDCPAPKTCPSGASACTCPSPGPGAGEGCASGATSCQPGGKIYTCASTGGCDVFTLSTTCATGACGSKGTCCPAIGANAGDGCTTDGATSCGSGASTLLTCARAADGCLTWGASTCTDSLVCGGTPAACQCPAQYPIVKYVVDPSSSNAAWRPTGTTQPGCSYARLTDALAAPRPTGFTALPIMVQGASVQPEWLPSHAYSAGATVSPVWSNGHFYAASAAGTTAVTEPTWCTTSGCTVADGSVTWKESGSAKAVELNAETFPIVIKGNVRVMSAGCDIGASSGCTPNGYVIRFKGPTAYAAVDVAAIGAIPSFRGFRVANDSATPPGAMVKTSSGSVGLTYVEAFGDSDVNTVRASTGFLAAGPSATIILSSARRCAGFGAVVSATTSLSSDRFSDNSGGGISIGGGSASIDGTAIDHNGGPGLRVESGSLTLSNATIFRNATGGVTFPAGTTSATLVAFKNNAVYCNGGAQLSFLAPQLGGAAYDLSGGDTACGTPIAASRIYGYGSGSPGTIGVLNEPANAAGANASWISWASGASSPTSGADFSGLTSAQTTAASTQSCSFTPPACPP